MKTKKIISSILEFVWPFKKWIFYELLVNVVWAIDISLRPYLLKVILDRLPHLNPGEATAALFYPASGYIFMSFLMMAAFRLYDYSWLNFHPYVKRHIGHTLMERMMKHSHQLFQNNFAGSLGTKIKDVMNGVPDLLRLFINDCTGHLLALLIAIFAFWQISPIFSLFLGVWSFIFFGGSLLLTRRAKKLSDDAAEERSKIIGRIVDILSNIMSVRLFGAAPLESKNLRKSLDKWVVADKKRDWYFLYMSAFQGTSFALYNSFCLGWLIHSFNKGTVTAGDFAMIITMNMSIINFLWTLSQDIGKFAQIFGEISQGLSIVSAPLEITDRQDAIPLQVVEGKIVFDQVEFHYKDSKLLFQNKSVTIHPGQKVGLVGYSGGGKSTFANLILRLFDVTSGRILIDNQDIKNVTQHSLHTAIAMIPQDPSLFHRSLMENIHYGRPEASVDEVIDAAKRAHAHDFIMQLPHKYDSLVGERGIKLSGGQRQRIAIARALLKNAPILILDEATSQLDSVTENMIQQSLWELMQGKTTIVIAHRLSTLLKMDRILVFDEGKIVEEGSHTELLNLGGLYKTLWETQVGGFLVE